jgi:broad specificity phosphatase PhoE
VEQKALGITVYSSPVVRAVQTAEIIAAHTQSFVAIDPLLIETQCDIEGMAKPKEGFHEMEHNPSIREFPGTIQERMRQSFKERAAHGRDCVLVSHGDPLTLLYHHLCEKPLIIDFYRAEDYIVQGEIVRVLFENNRVTELSRFTV